MTSMERLSFRHEGHVFFIYDHTKKREEDDPKDAILYFYPSFVRIDDQVALVGGIIGLTDFCLEFIPQSVPSLVKLAGRNFGLLQHEDFIIGLGCSPDVPDTFLISHMQFVWSTFLLYQGSLSALKQRVSSKNFLNELKNVWDHYLPLRQIQEDFLFQAFQVLPYVQLHRSLGHLFLHASHILQRSLRHKGVLAGALLNKSRVLCTQLSNDLTRQLLLLMSHSQFPCVEANSVTELPGGVRLLRVYLPQNECAGLGHRRKKAYVYPRSQAEEEVEGSEQTLKKKSSSAVPDKTSEQNFFSDGAVSSGGEPVNRRMGANFGDEVSSASRSSSRREGKGSLASSSRGLSSGTDSEVFLDTLSDMTFDNSTQLKLSDIKRVECAASNLPAIPPHSSASVSDPEVVQTSNDIHEQAETALRQKVESSVHEEHKSPLNMEKTSSDSVVDKPSSGDHSSNLKKIQSYIPASHNGIIELAGNTFDHAVSGNEIVNTALNFNTNNIKNKNENAVGFIKEHVDTSSQTSDVGQKTVVQSENADSLTSMNHMAVISDQEAQGSSDSANSSITSPNLSHLDSVSSKHEQNKDHHKLQSASENEVSIPRNDNKRQTNSESDNSSPTSQGDRDEEEGDSEIRKVEIRISAPSPYYETGDRVSDGDSYIKNSNPTYEDDNDTYSDRSSKLSLDQSYSQNMEDFEMNTVVENSRSDTVNSLATDSSCSSSRLLSSLNSPILSEENAFNVAQTLAQNKQEIDASLEVRFSGDDSSTHSSSDMKSEDRDASNLSLAYSEVSSMKDRLTFVSMDSENSESGLLSPMSDHLSPVTESSRRLMDDKSPSRSGSEGDTRRTFRIKNQSSEVGEVFSSDRSRVSDTSLSEWDPQRSGLQEMTLYAQGLSDTLLLLLISQNVKCSRAYVNSLWRSCLSHLAELDYQVKDAERHAKDDSENLGAKYQYIKYDSFTQNLKGSALLPVTSLANEIVDSSIKMHESFSGMPDLQEITYRSHSASCYGRRTINTETYFQLGLSKTSAGIFPPDDKTFYLDQMAEKSLAE